MRLLALLTDAFGGSGGIALYNRDLLTACCAHPDCEEVVAIPRLVPNDCEPLPEKLTYVIGGIDSKPRYVATAARTVCRNRRFDLIVCGHINLLPVAFALRRWVSAPVLLEIYGIDAWKATGSTLSNYLAGKVDYFASISEVTKRHFLGWSGVAESRGFVLPNAIHSELYGPGPKNRELLERYGLEGKIVILTLGRLSANERYKGFDETMEQLPELKKEIPDVAYLIVGDGTDRQRLEAKARALGVADSVVFAGHVPEFEKADYYRLADTFVMPSSGEGFGFVFLEAMACGVPVVASRTDGGREAVREGRLGILVDPSNPLEIRAGILEALGTPRRGVPVGLDHFSFENFTVRVHEILDRVLRPCAS